MTTLRDIVTSIKVCAVMVGLWTAIAVIMLSWQNDFEISHKPWSTGTVANSPLGLMNKHNCWDINKKNMPIPGHVVVTRYGATGPVYGGKRLTERALEQMFEGKEYG